ncbi:MAG: DUF2851 family protein [bacterium]|nr:DUF2851 family protein [bacterium]
MDNIADQVIKYGEVILQMVWAGLARGSEFKTVSGDSLTVNYPGTWNLEEGPDFLNAEICINGIILKGNIEIHNTPADWYSHGHQNDSLYSNVILHVIKKSPIKNSKSPDIQTILLPEFMIFEFLRKNNNQKVYYKEGFCRSKFQCQSDNSICNYLGEIGINRLNNKVIIYTSEILKIGVENAFLKYFFKACGYKKNKDSFLELYERISKYDFDKLDNESKTALLWGESELLPDPSVIKLDKTIYEFVKSIWDRWWLICKKDLNSKAINWNLSAVRPFNSPYRRLAALNKLIVDFDSQPFLYYLSLIRDDKDYSKLVFLMIDSLKCDDLIWSQYINFNKRINKPSSLVGRNRALEIVGNLILPFIIAYSKIKNDSQLGEKAFAVWRDMPAGQINIIQKISLKRWGLENRKVSKIFKTFAAKQGTIFLHKNMCEFTHMNCRMCPVININHK